MSDAPTLIPGTNPAGTPVEGDGDPLAPPDDMGASVIAAFERREKATAAAAGKDLGEGPPGGFPSLDDAASNVTTRIDASQAGAGASPVVGPPATEPAEAPPAAPGGSPATEPAEPGATPPPAAPEPAAPATAPTMEPPATTTSVPGGAPEEGAGAQETAAPAPSGYTWAYTDGAEQKSVRFDDAQVQRALGIASWAESLAPEVQQAIGSIETGQAVAIPRSDFDAFQAWKAEQGRVNRDADLESLDLDPAVAEILRKQRDEIEVLKGQAPAQPTVDPQYQQQVNAGIEQDRALMSAAMETYAQVRGLTADEVQGLLGAAVHAQVIPSLVEAGTQFNPANGSVLVPADMAAVTEQALDWALIRNPHLKTRVLAGQQPTGQIVQGAQPPAGTPVIDQVQARKARAGSLATAPSGAAPPMPAQTVQAMSQSDIAAAMARDIEAAMQSS